MNFQLGDTEKVAYALTELDVDSNPATPEAGDVITVASSDTASITVVPDATVASGSVASRFPVGGTKLQTGVQITASIAHADGTPTLTVTDLVDVVGGKASSLSL